MERPDRADPAVDFVGLSGLLSGPLLLQRVRAALPVLLERAEVVLDDGDALAEAGEIDENSQGERGGGVEQNKRALHHAAGS